MPVCFVPNCGCTEVGLLPTGPERYLPICQRHAEEWKTSFHRKMLDEIKGQFGRWGAEKLFHDWAATEAQGLDIDQTLSLL